jgi:GNAT superfamily N-acetyltransferase
MSIPNTQVAQIESATCIPKFSSGKLRVSRYHAAQYSPNFGHAATHHELPIRRATLADEASILALAPRLVAFGPPPWREVEGMRANDRKVLSAALRSVGDDPLVLVAISSHSDIAGFIHIHSARDYYTECDHGHVADMVVAEHYEGQGIARQLLAAAERWTLDKGYDWLTIGVFEQNVRAAALYERSGFQKDIVRMLKPLKRRG